MVELSPEEQTVLESWVRTTTTEQRLALRARLILALAQGKSNREVAQAFAVRPATVSKWRTRFGRAGVAGLMDAPRSG